MIKARHHLQHRALDHRTHGQLDGLQSAFPDARVEEGLTQEKAEPVVKEEAKQEPVVKAAAINAGVQEKPVAVVESAPIPVAPAKAAEKVVSPEAPAQLPHQAGGPTAVITARPLKGFSPLTVQFYGSKSSSSNGRIVAYSWDFGDGDTSTKKNPINTYWSTTYGSRKFTAALTVTDNKGQTATTNAGIEVLSR